MSEISNEIIQALKQFLEALEDPNSRFDVVEFRREETLDGPLHTFERKDLSRDELLERIEDE